ncbi:MAG TPA: hypothetical protein VNW06_11225 [Cytophagaceae bacterium]|jgi:hypothetical protein|nr:hypothetical protein [Cytophagaceae bacterium]
MKSFVMTYESFIAAYSDEPKINNVEIQKLTEDEFKITIFYNEDKMILIHFNEGDYEITGDKFTDGDKADIFFKNLLSNKEFDTGLKKFDISELKDEITAEDFIATIKFKVGGIRNKV